MYLTHVEQGSFPVGSGRAHERFSGLFEGEEEDLGEETNVGQSRGQYCDSVCSQMPFPHTGVVIRDEKRALADDREAIVGNDADGRDEGGFEYDSDAC